MTEEIISCDFYDEKICILFSKYFGFNVECKNLSLCTVDGDDEKECPIKRLEQENKELKEKLEKIYRLSDIAYDKILNSTEVSYGLNEIIDIQKIIKDDKTIYYDISACDTEKYRSALEEIRKIAKDAKEYRYSTKSEDYSEGMHTIGCYVLDKINEVIGNESN